MSKVLLVADAPWVVNEVRAALSLGDWDVEELDDPSQAASLSAEQEADAVVVDMQVASMGGMAVIRDIRQSTAGGRRPRLVLLLDRSADTFLAKRAGADACVTKPITAVELRKALAPAARAAGGHSIEEE